MQPVLGSYNYKFYPKIAVMLKLQQIGFLESGLMLWSAYYRQTTRDLHNCRPLNRILCRRTVRWKKIKLKSSLLQKICIKFKQHLGLNNSQQAVNYPTPSNQQHPQQGYPPNTVIIQGKHREVKNIFKYLLRSWTSIKWPCAWRRHITRGVSWIWHWEYVWAGSNPGTCRSER